MLNSWLRKSIDFAEARTGSTWSPSRRLACRELGLRDKTSMAGAKRNVARTAILLARAQSA